MFVPQLENLKKIVEDNDLAALDRLLTPNNRVQNKTQGFKSALMLSAHNINHLLKIDVLASDCIMLNLEDGVSPELKPLAVRLAAYFLSIIPQSSKKIIVRVNAIDEGGLDEIRFLNAYRPDGIRIPKVKTARDIEKTLNVLDESIELHVSIETKEALSSLKTLQCEGRVKAVYLGILDLLDDLGLSQTLLKPENPMIHYLLSEFLISAKIIGAYPVSFVYKDYKNMDELKRCISLEKLMGFSAKGGVSPAQSEEIMKQFTLEDKELQKAEYIIALFEKMRAQGVTGFADEKYGFIDEPIYKGALKIINQK